MAKLLSLQDCCHILKTHLQSDEFEVLQYEENQTFAPYSLLEVSFYVNSIPSKARFFVKKLANDKEIFPHDMLCNELQNEYPAFDNSFAPKHYFVRHNELIVFEDQHFTLPKVLDLDNIKLALKTLAKYHAGSIAYEEIKSKRLGKPYQLIEDYPTYLKDEILESSWFRTSMKALNALIDLFPENGLTHEKFKNSLQQIYEDSINLMKSHTFRNVVCHGFVWNKNLLFRYNGETPFDCKLINFELGLYQPPAFDVLQLIYMSTSTEMRKHHLHDLLDHYYNCLKNELHAGNLKVNELVPLKEDFEVSIHHFLPLIKLRTACFHQIQCLTQKLTQNSTNILENMPLMIVNLYKTDKNFKKLMKETITELEHIITHTDLTTEDCFKIIKNKIGTTNYQLLNYKITPLGNISGYIGDHNKLKIEILLNKQKQIFNLFAKFMPKSKTGIDLATDTNAFVKETFIYQGFVPMVQSFGVDIITDCGVPCYFTRHNDVMVFDDFETFSYRTLDSRKPFSIEILKMVVKKMAKSHASSIILEEKLSEKTKSKYRLHDHFPKELMESLFTLTENHHGGRCIQAGFEAVEHELTLFPDPNSPISDEEVKIKMEKAFKRAYELVKPSTEFRNVICHGDLWVNNILVQVVDGKPTDCRFIDYQMTRYCPPAEDLLIFMYLTTNRSTREKYFTELVNLYHNELAGNLEKYGYNIDEIYPYDTFMESVEYMTPQAVCQTVISFHLNLITSDILKEHVDENVYRNILLGDRRNFLTYVAQRDPLFVERASESVQDLREMCLKYF